MKQAELIKLELGNYKLTDDIYHYSLIKKLDSNLCVMYIIKEIRRGEMLMLFPFGDNELRGNMSVGGIYIHSDDMYFSLINLKLVKE